MAIPWLAASGIPPNSVRRKYLRRSGGSPEMKVNGSRTAPIEFAYTVPTGGQFLLLGIGFGLIDAHVDPHRFGDIPALANGLLFEIREADGTVNDMVDGEGIKRNADFALIDGGNFSRLDGAANALLICSWEASGDNEPLILLADWKIVVGVRDNITKLEFFRTFIKGRWVPDA